MGNKEAVNQLDDQNGSKVVAKTASATPDAPEVADSIGGPSRTRTLDPLIKRPSQQITPHHTDGLSERQLGFWPEPE
jgi:hypothetical protein